MKRLILLFFMFALCSSIVYAVETKVIGIGKANITGYDIESVRQEQDKKESTKAQKNKSETKKDKEIKKAIEQSTKRKEQDSSLGDSVRIAVVNEAQNNAIKNALSILIDRTLGADASKNSKIQNKFEDLLSQSDAYILDKEFSGEVRDNEYISKATLTIDETAFRELLSDMGVALNTQKVRQSAILIVLDEFFAAPSDLNSTAPTKESTTYLKDVEINQKNKTNMNVKAGDTVIYGKEERVVSASANYGEFSDFSGKEKEFFQKIIEYSPKEPKAQNLNYTQPALVSAFNTYDIRAIDNDIFKSKFFKGKPITADKLSNSEELASYVDFAKDTAKTDFFAIGVSYITDDGINKNTGKNMTTGNVFVKIYSTQDGEIIASGSFTEISSGNSSDQARVNVANKIGKELGETLAKKIQDYWKKRSMYGSEYIVQIYGPFLPADRIRINKAVKETVGVDSSSIRNSDSQKCEYVVTYSGSEPIGDSIFLKLTESTLADKFSNYDYKMNGNNIVFSPINKK